MATLRMPPLKGCPSMNRTRAQRLYQSALTYTKTHRPQMLRVARATGPHTFEKLSSTHFLEEYCWVVYASGFKFATVEQRFPLIKKAFKNFELTAVVRMKSVARPLAV